MGQHFDTRLIKMVLIEFLNIQQTDGKNACSNASHSINQKKGTPQKRLRQRLVLNFIKTYFYNNVAHSAHTAPRAHRTPRAHRAHGGPWKISRYMRSVKKYIEGTHTGRINQTHICRNDSCDLVYSN